MVNIKSQQIFDIAKLPANIDSFICSSGYESRSTNAYIKINGLGLTIKEKVCFEFTDNPNHVRDENDSFFRQHNFEIYTQDGNSSERIISYLNELFQKQQRQKVADIVVDYSCMTRVWYGEIISFFKTHTRGDIIFNLYFIYSHARYIKPPEIDIYNTYVGPVTGYSTLSIPERPTALIIGLGYEKNRAYSLKEYLDAEEVYLFIAENNNNEFIDAVYKENELLIKQTPPENIFHYPIYDLTYTEKILINLCESLLRGYRIVLAPCGPKPFTLVNFVASSRLQDIDVWRVSAGNAALPINRTPSGDVLTYQLQFNLS